MPVSAAAAETAQGWASGLAWPRDGRDEESWQQAVLAEELASLDAGAWEPPSEEELWGCAPDPDSDPPSDAEADVPAHVWADGGAAQPGAAPGTPVPHPALAGFADGGTPDTPGERGMPGPDAALAGFGEGGALDVLAPGAALAGAAAAAWGGGLDRLCEDELIGVVRGWRRLSSWAAAGELAVVAELMARCDRGHDGGGRCQPVDCVAGELACALTLTRRGADGLVDRALRLAELPATAAALERGRIDVPKTLVITDGLAGLDPRLALAVEDLVLAKAAGQTTGELRAAVRRAVLAADPAAAQSRRETAEKDARVELWDEPAGTKALAGRDLPPADALAADKRISAIARELKAAGAAGTLDLLRAKVYLALLAGQPLDHLLRTAAATEPSGPAGTDGLPGTDGAADAFGNASQGAARGTGTAVPAPALRSSDSTGSDSSVSGAPAAAGVGRAASAALAAAPTPGEAVGTSAGSFLSGLGPLAGSVNLTIPLTTLLGLAESPGEVAGFGSVEAATSRLLAGAAAQHRATTWCLTITGPTGQVIGHGCARKARTGPNATARARAAPGPAGPDAPACRNSHADDDSHVDRAGPDCPAEHDGRSGLDAAISMHLASARGDPGAAASMNLAVTIDPLALAPCAHERETVGYHLTPQLRHLIEIRDKTCSFPGCRRPATRCDKDHTVPFDHGGRTCECNLAALCRAHHQLKQARGWRLIQLRPGVLQWTTPSGRTYTTGQP